VNRSNVELAALCDIDQAVLDRSVKTLERAGKKAPATFTDVRKLIEDKSIDAISIATPNHWHPPALRPFDYERLHGQSRVTGETVGSARPRAWPGVRGRILTGRRPEFVDGRLGTCLTAVDFRPADRGFAGHD